VLACILFDNDGYGTLGYKETVVLAAALQQTSKVFYDIRFRCHANYVPCPRLSQRYSCRVSHPSTRHPR
jgi:hypothetical protein